ncbi:MAG: hypothetical protein AAGB00_03575 [Planctomycetota bacterium]
MIVLTAGTVLSVALAAALQGALWGIGLLAAVGSMGLTLLLHAVLYRIVSLFGPANPGPGQNSPDGLSRGSLDGGGETP